MIVTVMTVLLSLSRFSVSLAVRMPRCTDRDQPQASAHSARHSYFQWGRSEFRPDGNLCGKGTNRCVVAMRKDG